MQILLSSGEGMAVVKFQCVCCLQDIVDGEIPEGLQCGHMFHNECIRRYKEVKGLQNFKDLACPTCKNTGWDVDRLEAEQNGLLTAQPPTAAIAAEIVDLFAPSPPGQLHAEPEVLDSSAAVPDLDAEARSSAVPEVLDSIVRVGPIEKFLVPPLAMPIQMKMAQEGFSIECVPAWNSHAQDPQAGDVCRLQRAMREI